MVEKLQDDYFIAKISVQFIMHRLTVLYGYPQNPTEFDRYYHEVHLPLARQMQGLTGWTIGKCESAVPGQAPACCMIVNLYAASKTALEQILASPEGQAAIADVNNFATGGATFFFDSPETLIPFSLP